MAWSDAARAAAREARRRSMKSTRTFGAFVQKNRIFGRKPTTLIDRDDMAGRLTRAKKMYMKDYHPGKGMREMVYTQATQVNQGLGQPMLIARKRRRK